MSLWVCTEGEGNNVFSGVKDAVSGAKNAVSEVASGVADVGRTAKGAAGVMGNAIEGAFERDIFELRSITKMVGKAAEVLSGQRGIGSVAGGALDSLGLPDWATDVASAALDTVSGRPDAAIPNILSATSGLSEKAGLDGVSDFLNSASDITGMAGVSKGMPSVASASGGDGAGLVPDILAADRGQAMDLVGQADRFADGIECANTAIVAQREGDIRGAGQALFGAMDHNLQAVFAICQQGGEEGPAVGVGELFDGITSEVQAVIRELEKGSAVGFENAADAFTEGLDGVRDGLPGLIAELAIRSDESSSLVDVFDSEAGQRFEEAMTMAVADTEFRGVAGLEISASDLVRQSLSVTADMLAMASVDAEVASELGEMLQQIGSLQNANVISDMRGIHVQG